MPSLDSVVIAAHAITLGEQAALQRWHDGREWTALEYLLEKRTSMTKEEVQALPLDGDFVAFLDKVFMAIVEAARFQKLAHYNFQDVDFSNLEGEKQT